MTDKDDARALFLRGLGCLDARAFAEAEALFYQTLTIAPRSLPTLNNLAIAQFEQKHFADAEQSAERALAIDPASLDAHTMALSCQLERNDHGKALASCQAIGLLDPPAQALCTVAYAFARLDRPQDAIGAFDRALAHDPDLAEAWVGRGNAAHKLRRYADAVAAYDRALVLKSDLSDIEGLRLHLKMQICDWRNYEAECAQVLAAVHTKKNSIAPFELLALPSSPREQLICAETYTARKFPPSRAPLWHGERYAHDKIRLGYVSADFREHATSYLMARVFELHDRRRFEVTAISLGADDRSPMRARLQRAFDRFVDASALGDAEIAAAIRGAEIDILVDLNVLFAGSRPGIFALRPAPVQVNYLGYPGTMGAPYMDYVIADPIVIPPADQANYSEAVVYLPGCYQANDSTRAAADRVMTRAELGLPERGFVFCCFNNSFKITPHIFDVWVTILREVEGSVLWLLQDNDTAADNLRQEAAARGINPNRLVFAKRLPLAEHLARHRMADLFLDTLPCNAHTTASDALWTGLPVLTKIGDTFAGRVAASLLTAVDLPELIASTAADYRRLAVALASNPGWLEAIKTKLARNRTISPLFNSDLTTRHLEVAFTAMHRASG